MKRGKKLTLLLAVLVVLLAVTCAVLKFAPEDADTETEDPGVSVFTLDPETAAELTWTYEGETLTFVKAGDGWTYAGDSAFPLEESYLTSMLAALSDVIASKTIEAPGGPVPVRAVGTGLRCDRDGGCYNRVADRR